MHQMMCQIKPASSDLGRADPVFPCVHYSRSKSDQVKELECVHKEIAKKVKKQHVLFLCTWLLCSLIAALLLVRY